MKELKEKVFTEGVESTAAQEKEEVFNPLKL